VTRFLVSDDGSIHLQRSTGHADADGDVLVVGGFVNAHSHSFQRALRGRVEVAGDGLDDFWSWREAMYQDANAVSADDVEALSAWAFLDMVEAGFVAVGEFHYLHHVDEADPLASSRAVARAARTAGIRLVLLQTAYARAGFMDPRPTPRQRRFVFASVDAFLDHAAAAREAVDGDGVSSGLSIHSVRACAPDWIEAVADRAQRWGVPLHVHACEQTREVEDCRAHTGLSPIALLDRCGALTPSTTIVHGTHVDDDDIALLAARGCVVCITPSTERNLGDGLARIKDLIDAGIAICIGTDSHARIDIADELRSLEDHERLRLRRRHVLTPPGGRLARALIPAGTAVGARSLGLSGARGSVVLAMPPEGVAGADVGLDAWLVGGSSRDVVTATDTAGRVLFDARSVGHSVGHSVGSSDAAAIRARGQAVLRRLAVR
jgi:formimidoylglutamate deiminase